jgi:hypothetical protein
MLTVVRHKSGTMAIDVHFHFVPFLIEKHISVSALSSKIYRRLVWQKAMRIKLVHRM